MPASISQQFQQRYADLTTGLDGCRDFENFVNRLLRAQGDETGIDLEAELSELRDVMKGIADNLERADEATLEARLDTVEADLLRASSKLMAEDNRLSPSDLRRFLGRVQRLDGALLLAILHFYLFSQRDSAWSIDTIDKVDLLMSRLGHEIGGPLLHREPKRLESTLARLWATSTSEAARPAVVQALRSRVLDIATQVAGIQTLDELEETGLIPEYRQLKHGMGRLLIEPTIANAVLGTNAALGRIMERLYGDQAWSLEADFARFAEVEREAGVSEGLSIELDSLRRDMDRIEQGRKVDDVRFDAVQRMRHQIRELRPYLINEPGEVLEAPAAPRRDSGTAEAPRQLFRESNLGWELMGRLFTQLERLLAASGSIDEAETILQDPGLPFDLERCELAAFLWMRDNEGVDSKAKRLVLTSAALRMRLAGQRGQLEAGASGDVEQDALRSLTLAEELLADFDVLIAAAESEDDPLWAAEARFLKVLLMRDYSTLWIELLGGPPSLRPHSIS